MPVRLAGHRPGGPAETPEHKRVTVCAQANAREPPIWTVLRHRLSAILSAHNWRISALKCACCRFSCQPHEIGAVGRFRQLATAPNQYACA